MKYIISILLNSVKTDFAFSPSHSNIEYTLTFLSKPKNKKAVDLLKKGYSLTEVSKIVSLSYNSVSKISKLSVIHA